jgi:tryptophan synthase alpha chain
MSLSALGAAFRRGPAVSPFLVLGDPTPALSVELARTAVEAGAGMLEIGFPYSDPVADGPAVQAAAQRALAGGTSTRTGFRLLERIADVCPGVPLNLLVYGNLVHRIGYERFADTVADAGASSLLVPDIPLEEAGPLRRACRQSRLGHVELAGPLTPAPRLRKLAKASRFVYLAGFQGVTGVRRGGFAGVLDRVSGVAASVSVPVCLGFGLSDREQIARAFGAGARIAVVGSHLARVVERLFETPGNPERLLAGYRSAVMRLTAEE